MVEVALKVGDAVKWDGISTVCRGVVVGGVDRWGCIEVQTCRKVPKWLESWGRKGMEVKIHRLPIGMMEIDDGQQSRR